MKILGISAFYHDSAACLVVDGRIVAAAQEERFTRKKHDERFPESAIAYCLEQAGLQMEEIDLVAFYEKPFLKFERLLETYLAFAPRGFVSFVKAMPVWLKQKLWMKAFIASELKFEGPIIFPEHHESHAASAFFPSPFEEAAFLTMDGVGEWATTSYGRGKGNHIEILGEIHFPHSLGMLYSAFTYYTGFKVNSGEYKVMGLAPYGKPIYREVILEKLVDVKEDGSLRFDMSYFDYCAGLTMTSSKFHELFGGPPRRPESPVTQKEMDLAASIQAVTEEIVMKMAHHVKREVGGDNLCLAGGVGLNCVANGKLLKSGLFKNIWIQPAAGDAGGALGAALIGAYEYEGRARHAHGVEDSQRGSYLGPEFTNVDIQKFLDSKKISHEFVADHELSRRVAEVMSQGKIIGWFQGRMEFGPRALGARSIIGDARSPEMQKKMNLKIKFRESFRPFAPSVLFEKMGEYFDVTTPSPYMLIVGNVLESRRRKMTTEEEALFGIDKLNVLRSDIPSVTHVDYSARLQSVHRETNPRYHALISRFDSDYGCPVIVNTSFNVRGEPIVCTPEDAYRCFMRTDIDYLVLGNYILDKRSQEKFEDKGDWKKEFVLD